MAQDTQQNNPGTNSATVALFQRAHAKMVTLQRVDEQLAGLLDQRRKLQEELRGVQSLINEEFERVMRAADEVPARMLAQYSEQARPRKNGAKSDTIRLEVAQAV